MKNYLSISNRRQFIKKGTLAATGASLAPLLISSCSPKKSDTMKEAVKEVMDDPGLWFKISLAQWSFHKAIFDGKMDTFTFIDKAKELGFEGVEYVNQFFKDKAEDFSFLDQLNARNKEHGLIQNLIMIDREGGLGTVDDAERTKAIENHYKWVHAAKYLGCGSIRVNAYGEGSAEDVSAAAIDGLGRLSEYAAKEGLNVIVENHGSYSSNGQWMANVLEQVGMDNCGSLPDFGNFCIKREEGNWRNCLEEYDRYKGTAELMPYAKAVSAKTNVFDADGNETETDYMRMMKIVKDAGFTGFVNVEYEGDGLTEEEGVIATMALLKKVGKALM